MSAHSPSSFAPSPDERSAATSYADVRYELLDGPLAERLQPSRLLEACERSCLLRAGSDGTRFEKLGARVFVHLVLADSQRLVLTGHISSVEPPRFDSEARLVAPGGIVVSLEGEPPEPYRAWLARPGVVS